MTKKEFVIAIADKLDRPVREINEFFDAFIFVLKEKLIAEEKVQLSKLGSFETQIRAERETVNPFTGEQLVIPEKRVVKFRPSSYLEELVNY